MTLLEVRPDALVDYGTAAAHAIIGALPGIDGWAIEPMPGETITVPAGGRAVAGTLGAATIILAVDPELVALVGAQPPDDLVEAAQALLLAGSTAIGSVFGDASLRDVVEVDPATVRGPAAHHASVAVALLANGSHRATLALHVPAEAMTAGAAPGLGPSAGPDPIAPREQPMTTTSGLDLLHDVEMELTAELGRARMLVREILDLAPGSVIELDRAAGSPVDVLVNGTLIARGEVVVIDEEFGIRITEVLGYQEDRSPDRRHG